jgi:hypothetical protein
MINPQAGLGAMMQASPQPQRGMPAGNMAQTMALAKKMSDSQLAEVLSGKNMDVPQYVAMTEAMGRKQLRTAMQGAQAMGAAKQPSEKQKLLAELQPQPQMQPPMQGQMPPQAGLAAVPAPNMDNVGMAGGGIIAFKDGEEVEDPELNSQTNKTGPNAFQQWMREHAWFGGSPEAGAPETPPISKVLPNTFEQPYVMSQTAGGAALPYRRQQGALSATPPTRDMGIAGISPDQAALLNTPYKDLPPETPQVNPVAAADAATKREAAERAASNAKAKSADTGTGTGTAGGKGSAGVAGLKAAAEASQPDTSKRKNYLDDLMSNGEDTQKQIAEMKNQGQGEFLMQLGASLMSTPNLGVALSKGVQAGLPGLAANRKEISALTKDQRDYSLNMAKAQEARQQGNEEQAFKYEQLAVDKAYKVGMVAAYMQRASAGAGTGTAKIDAQQHNAALNKASSQLALAMKDPRMARDLRTPEAQQKYMQDAYTANINLLQGKGGMPTGPQVFAMPGEDGPVLSR